MLVGVFILPKFWRMAASGGGAISRVQNVETKGNFYSLIFMG